MNKSVIFVIALITFSFCSSTQSDSYNGLIDQLVELNTAAGADSNTISILVSQISAAHKDNAAKYQGFAKDLKARCASGTTVLTDYVALLRQDRLNIQARATKATDANVGIVVERTKQVNSLKTSKTELKAMEARITLEVNTIVRYGAEAEKKMAIIKSLRDIITDELLKPSAATSFIQLNTYNNQLNELKTVLENSHDNLYTPLITSLLSLAQGSGFSDQKILAQILEILNRLETNLKAFRTKQNTEGRTNLRSMKKIAAEKMVQIQTVARLIATANSTVLENTNIVEVSTRDSASIDTDIVRKTAEIAYWSKLCVYQENLRVRAEAFANSYTSKIKDVSSRLLDLK